MVLIYLFLLFLFDASLSILLKNLLLRELCFLCLIFKGNIEYWLSIFFFCFYTHERWCSFEYHISLASLGHNIILMPEILVWHYALSLCFSFFPVDTSYSRKSLYMTNLLFLFQVFFWIVIFVSINYFWIERSALLPYINPQYYHKDITTPNKLKSKFSLCHTNENWKIYVC